MLRNKVLFTAMLFWLVEGGQKSTIKGGKKKKKRTPGQLILVKLAVKVIIGKSLIQN